MRSRRSSPPRLACWLLAASLPNSVAGRSTLGDLIEEFNRRPSGWLRRIWFWIAAIGLIARYGPGVLGSWSRDVRHAFRLLVRRPFHTVVSVLGLGMGLTATVTVFSFFSAAWGDPPGVVDARSLVKAEMLGVPTATGISGRSFRSDEAALALEGVPGLKGIAAFGPKSVTVQIGHELETVSARFVSPTYFDVLGTQPLAGRLLGPDDDRADADTVAISARLAQRLFANPEAAVGTVLRVADRDLRIVGVLPDKFAQTFSPSLRDRPDDSVFVPLALDHGWLGADPSLGWLTLVGRLKNGISEEDMVGMTESLARSIEAAQALPGRASIAFQDFMYGRDATVLWGFASLCMAAPLLLMIIGCANVANLRLAQATERAQEIAVRHSLGATRAVIIRMLVVESLVISVLAMLVAWVGTYALLLQFAAILPIAVPLDWVVAAFGCLATLGVTICSGLIPAWLGTGRNAAPQLKYSGHGSRARSRMRTGLVVVQVALSVTLLTMGALFVRTLQEIHWHQPPVLGQILVAQVDLATDAARSRPRATEAFEEVLVQRLSADPRIQGEGLLFATSLHSGGNMFYWLGDEPGAALQTTAVQRVTPSWFSAMNLGPLAGRLLQPLDTNDVAVVNKSLVDSLGSNAPVIGSTLRLSQGDRSVSRSVTIVGVVPDSVRLINRPLRPRPILYQSAPNPMPLKFTVAVRTTQVDGILRDLPRIFMDIEPSISWRNLETADQAVLRGAGPFTFLAASIAALGVVALIIVGLGLYAVTSYVVSLRTREFGVRMALGARKSDVVGVVLRHVGRLTLIGLASGVFLTAPIANLLRFLFLGLSPADPVALVSIAILLGGTTILAAILPARRAATADPLVALRAE